MKFGTACDAKLVVRHDRIKFDEYQFIKLNRLNKKKEKKLHHNYRFLFDSVHI